MLRAIRPAFVGALILIVFGVLTSAHDGAVASAGETISPGTVVTPANWQQYKQFMTDGMQALFGGGYAWKFPNDYQIVVAPTQHYELPPTYLEQTKRYAGQVKIMNLPDGRHTIDGYVGGIPFPNPQEPMKGWKLLVDDWYAYAPYILCANTVSLTFQDRFYNLTQEQSYFVQRLFSHRGDAGLTIDDPTSPGTYYTEIIGVLEPEQARYTTVLTLYYADLTRSEDTFLFVPALRRSIRLTAAARCSPAIGSDFANDDTRHGAFNGNPTRFDAEYLGDRRILEMPQPDDKLFSNIDKFVRPLFFPKPEVGKWEARDSYMIDVRRVPSQRAGYCYGKRILYCDKEVYQSIWADLYDENMKLWKIDYDPQGLIDVPGEGRRWTNDGWGIMFDVQNMHLTWVVLSGQHGAVKANSDCKNLDGVDYTDANRFSSVRGLSEIMR
jgi:hypothetical protein